MTSKQSLIVLLIEAIVTTLLGLSDPGFAQCPIPTVERILAPRFTPSN